MYRLSQPIEGTGLYRDVSRYKWSIIAVTIVATVSTLYFSSEQTPLYQSQAEVLVEAVPLPFESEDAPLAPNLATEKEVATSIVTAESVIEKLGLNESPRTVLRDLEVEIDVGAEIITFLYVDPSPTIAAEGAQAFADEYLESRETEALSSVKETRSVLRGEIEVINRRIAKLNQRIARTKGAPSRAALESRKNLLTDLLIQKELAELPLKNAPRVGRMIEPATISDVPISPRHPVNAVLGLIIGLLLGIGQASVRGRISERLWSADQLEAILGAPVLGTIPRLRNWRRTGPPGTIAHPKTPPHLIEAMKFVRSGVLSSASLRGAHTLLVTSAGAGEGKTVIAGNLAIALAWAGKSVILVSGNLRKPDLDHHFNVSGREGLSEALRGWSKARELLVPTALQGLQVLPAGHQPDDPAELLGSDTMAGLLAELRAGADFVIIDSASVTGLADTVSAAAHVDAVAFVVDAHGSDPTSVRLARRLLEKSGTYILGALVNRADPVRFESRSHYQIPSGWTDQPADVGRTRPPHFIT